MKKTLPMVLALGLCLHVSRNAVAADEIVRPENAPVAEESVINAKSWSDLFPTASTFTDGDTSFTLPDRLHSPAVTDEPFVLATYNVMYKAGFASSHPRYWQKRIPAVAELIKERSFDVFGTQEPDEDELPLLASELGGEYAHVGYGREEDHTGEGVPIFYRKARFECLKWGTFWLSSEENQDVSGSRYPGSKRPRICTWARFKDKTTGKCFRYFNTHLESEDEAARFFGMQLIMAKVNAAIARGETVFVSGDLNDTLDEMSDERRQALVEERGPVLTTDPAKSPVRLARSVLADSLDVSEAAHTGPNNTFHSWKGADAFCRLDYIFVTSNVTVKTHATLDDAYLNDGGDMKPPSDHFPVMTTVSLANCTDVGLPDDREGEGEGEQGGGDTKADPDTSWMAGSFGVSFHWTAKIVDNYGSKNWEQAVNDFDVGKFADSVESFGAKHVIFTTAHAWQKLPCPCTALDSLISGRTTQRDLLKDIIDELTNRNVRVVFYYNHSCNHNEDQPWDEASGYDAITDAQSMTNFANNICSIVRELSLRYGDGVSAWWFDSASSVDDSLPWTGNKTANNVAGLSFPWDDLFAAARAGNPHAAVAVNWDVHQVDQHGLATDYLSGETEKIDAYGNFFPFAPDELQDHIWTRMDSNDWFWQGGEVSGYGSRFTEEQLAWWKVSHRDAGRMATLNLVIDEAGNINPVVAQRLVNTKTIGKVWVRGRYDPTKWQAAPAASNLIRGAVGEFTGNRSGTSGSYHDTPMSVLTDGSVPNTEIVAGANLNAIATQIFGSKDEGDVFSWAFNVPSDIYGLNIYSRSGRSQYNGATDGGNDAIVVTKVEVQSAGSSEWTDIGAPSLSFGKQDGVSGGALAAKLVDGTGAPLAQNVTAIRFTQGAPENNKSLLVECEVIGCATGEEPPDDPEDDDPEDIANPTKALVNHFTFNLASKRYYDCIAKRDAVMVTETGSEAPDVDTSVPNDVAGSDKAIAIPMSYGLKVEHSIPTNKVSSYCLVLKFHSPTASDRQWRSFYRTVNNNNDAALFVKNNNTIGGTGAWGGYGTSTVTSGTWHTLIVSVDAEAGTRTAYYDGVLELRSDTLSGKQEDLTEKPYLYISVDDSNEDYTLYFDDIRIYNVAKPKAVFDGDTVRAGGPDDTIGEEPEPLPPPVYTLTIPVETGLVLGSVSTNGTSVAGSGNVYAIVSNTVVTVAFTAASGYELDGNDGIVTKTIVSDYSFVSSDYPAVKKQGGGEDPVDPPPGPGPGELVNGRANMKGWAMKRISTASKVASETGFGWSAADNPSSKSYSASESVMVFNEAQAVNTIQLFAPKSENNGIPQPVGQMPSAFKVFGSNDGSAWTTLLSIADEADWLSMECRYYTFSNETAYAQYKFSVESTVGGGAAKLGVYNYYRAKPADPATPWVYANNKLTRGDQEINVWKDGQTLKVSGSVAEGAVYDLDFTAGIVDGEGSALAYTFNLEQKLQNNKDLTRLIGGNVVSRINGWGCQNCWYLNEVSLGEAFTAFADRQAFENNYSLEWLDMESTPVETLPPNTFTCSYNLKGDLVLHVKTFSSKFNGSRLTSIRLDEVVTYGDNNYFAPFEGCTFLTNITLGANLTTINCKQAFGKIPVPVSLYWNSAPPEFTQDAPDVFNDKGFTKHMVTSYLPLDKRAEWETFADSVTKFKLDLPATEDGEGTWYTGTSFEQYVRWLPPTPDPAPSRGLIIYLR